MPGTPLLTPRDGQRLVDSAPFGVWWGYEVESIGEGTATARLPYRDEFLRPGGYLQGGCAMGLADVTFWLALMSLVGEETMALTVEMKTNFLHGAKGDLRCEAQVLKLGRRLVYGDASTTDADENLIAHHTLTYMRPS